MEKFKLIQESDFGNISEIFKQFFKNEKQPNNKIITCKITKKEAKQGTNKKININTNEIDVKIPPKVKQNDIIKIGENLYIQIHIYGNKSKRKGRIIYE